MYRGGKGDRTARRFARFWTRVFSLGLMPRRWVALEVAGRRSGNVTRFPLGMSDVDGHWYLVSMLGEQANWVAQHSLLMATAWPMVLLVVFVPLSVLRYRRLGR